MLNLTKVDLNKIKELLIKEQKKVEDDLKEIDSTDPVLDGSLAESSEPGTDSWMADTHGRVVAMKNNLIDMLSGIKKALTKLNTGKYGVCENCGKQIETERLNAMPTANFCMTCSKKKL